MKKWIMDFVLNNSERMLELAWQSLLFLLVIFSAWMVIRIIRRTLTAAEKKYEQFDETLVPVLTTVAGYLVFAVALVIILDILGVDTTSIIALLGAAGLAVGLALKDTLANIAAGVMLLVLRPFRRGDYIESGSFAGSVNEINLFSTILETFDGLYVAAPNSIVWGNAVKNYTRNGKRRMDISVGISYRDSIDKAMEALQQIIDSEVRFLKDPAAQIIVHSMGDSSVNLQLRAWADTSDYWGCYWDNNKKVKEAVEAAGLTIPFPQVDVHYSGETGK